MALKFKYESREAIPAEHAGFYTEREGAWVLDVDGAVERSKVEEFRTTNVALMKERDELKRRFERSDSEAVRAVAAERDALNARLSAIQIDQAVVTEATKRGLRARAMPARSSNAGCLRQTRFRAGHACWGGAFERICRLAIAGLVPCLTMKTLCAVMPIFLVLAMPSPLRADPSLAKEGKKQEPMDARSLLEKGRASGKLPEGLVIRVGACLGESELKASGDDTTDELRETWEFAANQVIRVVFEEDKENRESRPFDSKDLCKDLLEGKAIEIQARKGKGPEVGFVGTHYHRGSRSIEVVWKGKTILRLLETNGPFRQLYRESDARAFGALYERLAEQARAAFQSKPA